MEQIIIGESPQLLGLLDEVSRLAPINRPLLILGERGTGKELIGERIHFLSQRWEQPFIKINCAAFTEQLLESELFGHEAGAFTGANRQHQGHFERANQGTIFLDELATLSSSAQEKLLRIIEYGEFQRIGGHQTLSTDVRIVAATNGDIAHMTEEGKFRADLLDRLAFDVLHVPSLAEREGDIALLVEHFAMKMTQELGQEVFPGFSNKAMEKFLAHPWPGNIRELKNAVERSLARCRNWQSPIDEVKIHIFGPRSQPAVSRELSLDKSYPIDFETQVEQFTRQLLLKSLEDHQFRQKDTANNIGLRYDQLRYLVRKYDLSANQSD